MALFVACNSSKYDEFSYHGKSFKQWYFHWSKATETGDKAAENEARDAIKQMGTNVMPLLVSDLRAYIEQEKTPEIPVSVVFRILGPSGAPALPKLEAMMCQTNISALNHPASCLVDIGDDALPVISRLLTNAHPPTRYYTAYAFSGAVMYGHTYAHATNLLVVVPPLAACCEDADPSTAIAAIRALAAINLGPETTLPALRGALQSTNKYVREEAAGALGKIGQ